MPRSTVHAVNRRAGYCALPLGANLGSIAIRAIRGRFRLLPIAGCQLLTASSLCSLWWILLFAGRLASSSLNGNFWLLS